MGCQGSTYHVLGNLLAVVAGAVESLPRESKTNRSVDTGALLRYHRVSNVEPGPGEVL